MIVGERIPDGRRSVNNKLTSTGKRTVAYIYHKTKPLTLDTFEDVTWEDLNTVVRVLKIFNEQSKSI